MSMFDTTGAESCRRCGENARAEVERLQAENAKLQAEIAELEGTIECLKGLADATSAENAQLRERVAELEELTDDKRYIPQEWYQLATTENARLRKMVLDLYECVSHANEQDWFHFERHMLGCGMSCAVNGESCGLSVFADRLRELGIEVE